MQKSRLSLSRASRIVEVYFASAGMQVVAAPSDDDKCVEIDPCGHAPKPIRRTLTALEGNIIMPSCTILP